MNTDAKYWTGSKNHSIKSLTVTLSSLFWFWWWSNLHSIGTDKDPFNRTPMLLCFACMCKGLSVLLKEGYKIVKRQWLPLFLVRGTNISYFKLKYQNKRMTKLNEILYLFCALWWSNKASSAPHPTPDPNFKMQKPSKCTEKFPLINPNWLYNQTYPNTSYSFSWQCLL